MVVLVFTHNDRIEDRGQRGVVDLQALPEKRLARGRHDERWTTASLSISISTARPARLWRLFFFARERFRAWTSLFDSSRRSTGQAIPSASAQELL